VSSQAASSTDDDFGISERHNDPQAVASDGCLSVRIRRDDCLSDKLAFEGASAQTHLRIAYVLMERTVT
jgi:hypothetical protein